MKSSSLGGGGLVCIVKGRLLKDMGIRRYQTSMRVETKRWARRSVLEQMRQGCNIWKVVWLGYRKGRTMRYDMNDFPFLFLAYKLAIRKLLAGGGGVEVGLYREIHLCLSCSFVPCLLGHKSHIPSRSSQSVTRPCSGSTFFTTNQW